MGCIWSKKSKTKANASVSGAKVHKSSSGSGAYKSKSATSNHRGNNHKARTHSIDDDSNSHSDHNEIVGDTNHAGDGGWNTNTYVVGVTSSGCDVDNSYSGAGGFTATSNDQGCASRGGGGGYSGGGYSGGGDYGGSSGGGGPSKCPTKRISPLGRECTRLKPPCSK